MHETASQHEVLAIPPAALSGMEGWNATVAWALNPDVVTWRLMAQQGEIRYLKVARLGKEVGLLAERDRMAWAASRLPVPQLLAYGSEGGYEWLLTRGLPGVTAIDAAWLAAPARLVPLLAEGLRRVHALPIHDCPFDCRVATVVQEVWDRMQRSHTDNTNKFHTDVDVSRLASSLSHIERLRPEHEDLVVCHGDYCLPNVLISENRVAGYIDLGDLGVADRWADLTMATWSVTYNLGPGWEDIFLARYGVARDDRKMDFYRLLSDLLP